LKEKLVKAMKEKLVQEIFWKFQIKGKPLKAMKEKIK